MSVDFETRLETSRGFLGLRGHELDQANGDAIADDGSIIYADK